jgi:hypothetical protein
MVCVRYRPRQPRASPVWQVLHDHAARLPGLSANAAGAIDAFLECGDLHAGFTRLHCPDCGHEFLLAFSCKQRGLCAACHQRRTLIEGAFIADEICAPVPHRHLVLTIPRLIRNTFKFDRALLGDLHHAAHSAISTWLRQRTGQPEGQPGLVVAVQTLGFRAARKPWRTKRNFEVFSASQFIAALLDQIPPKGVPQVRYYGWYSNKSRGLRQRAAGAAAGQAHAPPARLRRRRTASRELIKQVWGVDPLRCPLCSGLLRPIAVVETGAEIAAILAPLGLARPHERPFALGPPRPEVNVLIDAATGDRHVLDQPDFPPRLPYPQPRDAPIRFRAEVMEPGEDFDQTGFELPPPPQVVPADAGQGELFGDDYAQPDSADGEPVFWSASGGQAFTTDDGVQPDLSACDAQADAPDCAE